MFRRRAIRRLRACCRAMLAAATLVGLLIGTIGFTVAPRGIAGAAFPCQGGACGCRSAADCWLGCCCLTPAQRLAWAKANGVTPPPALVRLAAADTAHEAETKPLAACCSEKGNGKRSCCSHGETAACCAKAASEAAVVCDTGDDSSRSGSPLVRPLSPAKGERLADRVENESDADSSTPAFQPRRCRGTGHWWVAGGQPLALPERPMQATLPTGSQPVLIGTTLYALDAESPPTRPG